MCELGWKSLGVLELTALPSIDEEHWVPLVQETDALLVNGGDPLYLCHWMRQSGLADLLPSLRNTVYVGLSAGSIVMAPNIGEDFVRWTPPTGGDETLGIVDFSMFPHLDHEDLPDNSMADAEKWAAGMPVPAYAIDDQTDRHQSDRRHRRSRLRGSLNPADRRCVFGCSSIRGICNGDPMGSGSFLLPESPRIACNRKRLSEAAREEERGRVASVHAGFRPCWAEPTTRLPCRRSWVRVPSSALH
jgi:hypothetical protein